MGTAVLLTAALVAGAGASPAAAQERAAPPPGGGAGAGMPMPVPVRYEVADDLADIDGTERAWRLEEGIPERRVRALATALGLEPDPVPGEHGVVVTGSGGRRLEVDRYPGSPWTYTAGDEPRAPVEEVTPEPPSRRSFLRAWLDRLRRARSPWRADATQGPGDPTASPSTAPPSTPQPSTSQPPTTRPPVGAEGAESAARIVLRAAGVPLDGAEVVTDHFIGAWSVRVSRQLDGHPTIDWESYVRMTEDGRVLAASGWLADARPGPQVHLIGTDEALRRLRAGEAGYPDNDGNCELCPPGQETVTISVEGVSRGWRLFAVPGSGEHWVLPTYLFDVDMPDGSYVRPILGVDEPRFPPPLWPAAGPGCWLVGGDAIACWRAGIRPD